MVKHTLSVVMGFLLVILLAACSQTAEPTGKGDPSSTNEANEKSSLTVDQLFDRSTKASQNIKSFTVNMDMKQNMSGVPEVGEMAIDSTIDMKYVASPLQMHQKISMNMGEEAGNMDTEMYVTDAGMFMYDPTQGGWMKFPSEMSDQLMNLSNQQGNPADELKKLQSFVDDFSYEEDDKSYILKLSASGEKLNQFIQEKIQSLSPELAEGGMLNQQLKINNVKYEIVLDKETYLPNQLNIVMDLDINSEGESIHLNQEINGVYKGYNEFETITVPQEVLDTAVEMDM